MRKKFKNIPLISLSLIKKPEEIQKIHPLVETFQQNLHLFLKNSFFNSFIYLFLKNKFYKKKKFIFFFFIIILSFYISKYLILRKIKYLYFNSFNSDYFSRVRTIKKQLIRHRSKRRFLNLERLKRKKFLFFKLLIKYLRNKWKKQLMYLFDLFFLKKSNKFPIFLKRYQGKLIKLMKIRRFPLDTSIRDLSFLNLNTRAVKYFKFPLLKFKSMNLSNTFFTNDLLRSELGTYNAVNYFLFILLGNCLKQSVLYNFFFRRFILKKLITYLYYFNINLVQSQYRNMLYFRNYSYPKIIFKGKSEGAILKSKKARKQKRGIKTKFVKLSINKMNSTQKGFSIKKLAFIYIPNECLKINENLKMMKFNVLYHTFYNINTTLKKLDNTSFLFFLHLKRKMLKQYYLNNIVLTSTFGSTNDVLKHIAQR